MKRASVVVLACLAFSVSVCQAQAGKPFPYPLKVPTGDAAQHRAQGGSQSGAEIDSAELDPRQAGDMEMESRLETVLSIMGRGYNSFRAGGPMGDCVKGTIVGPTPGGRSSPSYSIDVIRSYEQFQSETHAEASVSADFASFSGSLKATFDQAESSTTNTQFLLVRERVAMNREIDLDNPQFKRNLPPSTDVNGQALFFRACGDQFVSHVVMGGEFIALVSFQATETDVQKSLDVDASVSTFSTDASMNFQTAMKDSQNKSKLHIYVRQIGGAGGRLPRYQLSPDGSVSNTAVALTLQYAEQFPAQVNLQTAAPIGMDTQPYEYIGGDTPDTSQATADYNTVKTAWFAAQQTMQRATILQGLFSRFGVPNASAWGGPSLVQRTMAAKSNAQSDYNAMGMALRNCANHFWVTASCTFNPRWLNYTQLEVGPFLYAPLSAISQDTVEFTLPRPMTLDLRGSYCYSGPTTCGYGADGAYIAVMGRGYPSDGVAYRGRPMRVGPGVVRVQTRDSDYSDNSGTMVVIAY